MRKSKRFELPDTLKNDYKRALKLEIISILYTLSVIALMIPVLGGSQAMKSALYENVLTMLAPLSFIIASRIVNKAPNKKFPYGYHRANSIAFLVAALALFSFGTMLIFDASASLISGKKPEINDVKIGGHTIWQGWLMIAVLIYGAIGPIILGPKKIPLARRLHSKVLFTDAETNKADYLTALAAVLGIIGIKIGFWWADATAALIISIAILKDGSKQIIVAVRDLINRTPQTADNKEDDPLIEKVESYFSQIEWIEKFEIRFREEGQVYFGEALIVPKKDTIELVEKLTVVHGEVREINWRIYDFCISPIKEIPVECRKQS